MSNVKSVSNCPKCKTLGHVIHHQNEFVMMECPNCKTKWPTVSEICPICKKTNGFATEGPCSHCYSERHKIS